MTSLLLTALLSWIAVPAAAPQNDRGDIAGSVTRLGGEPLAGVTVTVLTLTDIPAEVLASTMTGADGWFRVRDMPAGAYRVRAELEGFVSPPMGRGRTSASMALRALTGLEPNPSFTTRDASSRIDVRPDASANVNLVLMATGVVTGRVTDSNGQPLALARVEPLELMDYSGRPLLVPVRSGAKTTDDRGIYRLFRLVPGEYYLRVETEAPGAAPAYFPGVSDVAAAVPVVVRGGAEFSAADIRMPETSAVRLSGRAVVEGVVPESLEVSEVYLLGINPGLPIAPPGVYRNMAADRSDGNFLIEGVPPGLYDVYPLLESADPDDGGQDRFGFDDFSSLLENEPPAPVIGSTRVLVGDEDVDGIVSIVRAPLNVPGRVVGDLNGPPRFVQVSLAPLSPVPFGSWPPRAGLYSAERASDGSFRIPGVPRGQYRLGVSGLPQDVYVLGVSHNGIPAPGRVVTLDGPAASAEITLDVRAGAGVVAGLVDGFAVGATVLLVPNAPRQGEFISYRRADTDESGGYTFGNVAPGDYKLLAFERLVAGGGFSPDFVARYDRFGAEISVFPGPQRVPDLQVIDTNR